MRLLKNLIAKLQEVAKPGQSHMRNYGGTVCFSCRQFFRRAHQVSNNTYSSNTLDHFKIKNSFFGLVIRSRFLKCVFLTQMIADFRAIDIRTSSARTTVTVTSRRPTDGSVRSVATTAAWWPECVLWPYWRISRSRFDSSACFERKESSCQRRQTRSICRRKCKNLKTSISEELNDVPKNQWNVKRWERCRNWNPFIT